MGDCVPCAMHDFALSTSIPSCSVVVTRPNLIGHNLPAMGNGFLTYTHLFYQGIKGKRGRKGTRGEGGDLVIIPYLEIYTFDFDLWLGFLVIFFF